MSTRASIIALALPLFVIGSAPAFSQLAEPSMQESQSFTASQNCPTGQKSVGGRFGKCQNDSNNDGSIDPNSHVYHTRWHGVLATGIDTSNIQNDNVGSGGGPFWQRQNRPTGSGDSRTAGNQLGGSNAGNYGSMNFLSRGGDGN